MQTKHYSPTLAMEQWALDVIWCVSGLFLTGVTALLMAALVLYCPS